MLLMSQPLVTACVWTTRLASLYISYILIVSSINFLYSYFLVTFLMGLVHTCFRAWSVSQFFFWNKNHYGSQKKPPLQAPQEPMVECEHFPLLTDSETQSFPSCGVRFSPIAMIATAHWWIISVVHRPQWTDSLYWVYFPEVCLDEIFIYAVATR
mgnify:CR=1 FL=1